MKLWCNFQIEDKNGDILCTAHLAECRVFDCPYKDNGERLKSKYPCSDYKEVIHSEVYDGRLKRNSEIK